MVMTVQQVYGEYDNRKFMIFNVSELNKKLGTFISLHDQRKVPSN